MKTIHHAIAKYIELNNKRIKVINRTGVSARPPLDLPVVKAMPSSPEIDRFMSRFNLKGYQNAHR